MSYNIEEIEGIGPAYAEKLAGASIATTNDLLERCGTAKGRRDVSEETGLSEVQLLKWANLADLMRISGVGPQYSELLEGAGVDTVKELRNRIHQNLAEKMKEVNEAKRLAKASPPAATVAKWVEQAKSLEPRISH